MNDLISRKAAITAIQRYGVGSLDFSEDGWTPAEAERFVIRLLNDLPSAERKKGKWLVDGSWSEGFGMGESYGDYFKCSECGKRIRGGYGFCEDNFCPRCGSVMR